MITGSDLEDAIIKDAAWLLAIGATIGIVGFLAVRWLLAHVHIAF